MSQSRQLAAIMFTDIVGYTLLMGKDSAKALELVRISKEIQKPLVEKHHGQWLKEMGDGALAKFGTALDALNCAVEIQELARAKFDGKLRIGIHSGDITVENDDVYGDGVNVASRLESIADPGGIYISESIEKAFQGQTDVQAKYLGEVKLKNVAYGVRTYAVQGVGLPVPEVREDKELYGHFWAEVQRRGVIRAAVTYVAAGLLLVLLLRETQNWIALPDWSLTAVLAGLLVCFPIAMYLAWNYERSPEGFVRTTSQQSWRNPYSTAKRKPLTGSFVIAGLMLVIAFIYFYPSFQSSGQEPDTSELESNSRVIDRSIAVLPFADMSINKDQEYFSDGMAEEIINALVQIPGLKVASRTSAFQFRGQKYDIKSIAETLGVATVLEGSIRKSGNRIRITAQLINATDGFHLWSQTYERELEDIFVIQDELAKAIVSALQIQIIDTGGSLVTEQTTNIEAYNLYLQGRYFWNKRNPQALERSIKYFQDAIEKDSLYAMAYSGLADSFLMLSGWGYSTPSEIFPKGMEAVLRAIHLDNTLGQAYASLGAMQLWNEWDWQAAEESFKNAITLTPNYSQTYVWYFVFYTAMGDQENARIKIEKALELDPLSLVANFNFARYYLHNGKYSNALEQAHKTLEMDDSFVPIHWTLYDIYYGMGENDLAFEHFIQWRRAYGEASEILKTGYKESGWKGAAERMIPILNAKSSYVAPTTIAMYYVHLGNNEKALEYLERGYHERDNLMSQIRHNPFWKALHSEPRFKELLRKIGLPPVSN